jgi:hypothetical protein
MGWSVYLVLKVIPSPYRLQLFQTVLFPIRHSFTNNVEIALSNVFPLLQKTKNQEVDCVSLGITVNPVSIILPRGGTA